MVLEKLTKANAYLEGHFLLSSGKHSNRYCQCAKLFENPEIAHEVIGVLAEKIKDLEFDLIVGPAMGGIIAAYELSAQVGKRNVFAERENNIMCFRRGFDVADGEKVVIMEDVITTGKSTLEVAKVIEQKGGIVVAAGCIVNRCKQPLPFPIYAAAELEIDAYDPEECPLCKQGVPIVKPGSRKFE